MEFRESGKRSLWRKRPIFLQIAFVLVFVGVCACLQPVKAQNKRDKETQKEVVVEMADVYPEFPGGIDSLYRFLSGNIKYPKEAREKRIEGTVIVDFAIETDGSIFNVKVFRSVEASLDAEAVRIIESMPNWKPSTIGGKAVRFYYRLPIQFKLEDEESEEDTEEK